MELILLPFQIVGAIISVIFLIALIPLKIFLGLTLGFTSVIALLLLIGMLAFLFMAGTFPGVLFILLGLFLLLRGRK